MKRLLTLLAVAFSCLYAQAQTYNMNDTLVTTCSGIFYDDGGANGNYNDYVSHTQTFTSANGGRLTFNFSNFSTYNGNDLLTIYDGASVNSPVIGYYSGSYGAFSVTSSSTSLTFRFSTNSAGSSTAGWGATISCSSTPAPTIYSMSGGIVSDCSGIFYDGGGPTGNYANGQNAIQTFSSNNGQRIAFDFRRFQSNRFSLGSGDSLFVYDGNSIASPVIGIYTGTGQPELLVSSGTSLTFDFRTDAQNTSSGWQAEFYCTTSLPPTTSFDMSSGVRYTCGGSFYDDGGVNGNYDDYSTRIQTFTSTNNTRLSFNFTSFSTYNSNDYLEIYDGPSLNSPLIGIFSYVTSPGLFTSTGNSVTFRFVTNSAGSSTSGWAASIACAGPVLTNYPMSGGSVTACSGVFYDSGGPSGLYGNGENRIMTFQSGTAQRIVFDFNRFPNNRFALGSGDSLLVYDGPSISDPLIGIYVQNYPPELLTSTGTALTFQFKSDATSLGSGWQAEFYCDTARPAPVSYNLTGGVRYVCSGNFYDSGGPFGDYDDYSTRTQTFISKTGERLTFNFGGFYTYNGNDVLEVYDGPSINSPRIGAYSGTMTVGSITSTGSSLTFRFVPNSAATTGSGWNATIQCAGPVLTPYPMSGGTVQTCNGVFYDNGGPLNNYPAGDFRMQTFTAPFGQKVQADFNTFQLNRFSLGTGDTLWIYDGPSANDPLIGVYIGTYSPELITSTDSALTFVFKSDAITQSSGWQAIISCTSATTAPVNYNLSGGVRYVCSGNFYDSGGPFFDYDDYSNRIQTFVSRSLTQRLTVNFNGFSTYSSADYLEIYDGPGLSSPLIGVYSGNSFPGAITSTGNALTFRFITSSGGTTSSGWSATFNCAGPVLPVYNLSGGTTAACSGVFYDAGGATGNYSNGENRTQTFCAPTGSRLIFDFNNYPNNRFNLASGDTMRIYDGSSTAAPILGIYIGDGAPERIVSSGNCVTFSFTSNATSVASGWQVVFNCDSFPTVSIPTFNISTGTRFVCDALFYDDGGPSNSYNDYVTRTQTFFASNYNHLQAVFQQFSTYSTADYLQIYDGENTSFPLIGTYSGNNLPGTITSTGPALTFRFVTSSGGTTAAGWAATLKCIASPPIIDSISYTSTCVGSSITVSHSAATLFGTGNELILHISDAAGNFSTPVEVARVFSSGTGSFTFSIPAGLPSGNYRFRLTATVPSTQGPIYTNSIAITGILGDAVVNAGYTYKGDFGGNSYYLSNNPTNWATANQNAKAIGGSLIDIRSMAEYQFAQNIAFNENVHIGITDEAVEGTWLYTDGSPVSFFRWQFGQPDNLNNEDYASMQQGVWYDNAGNIVLRHLLKINALQNASILACTGNNITLTAPTISGATYQWSGPSGFSSLSQNPVLTSVGINQSGQYTVIISKNGCALTANRVNLTVDTVRLAATLTSNSPVCAGDSLRLFATATAGSSFSWRGPGNFTSTRQNPVLLAINGNSGAYICTIKRGTCTIVDTVFVTIGTNSPIVVALGGSGTNICAGSTITYTASVINGGSAPTYQWYLNNAPIPGATSVTFTSTSIQNGDRLYCRVTGNNTCASASNNVGNSPTVTFTVTQAVVPTVSVVCQTANFCAGDSVNFTAAYSNGGTGPFFLWYKNGVLQNVGVNFRYYNATNGDSIQVAMVSSVRCVTMDTVKSAAYYIVVGSAVAPSISISAPSYTICPGKALVVTAAVQNAGVPTITWFKNQTQVFTGTSTVYSYTGLAHGDTIWARVNAFGGCFSSSSASSNKQFVTVPVAVFPSITINASTTTACTSSPVSFTSTSANGGTNPQFTWFDNGVPVGSSSTYSASLIAGTHIIQARLISNATCALPDTVLSNAITVTVSAPVAPSLSIATLSGSTQFCLGSSVTFDEVSVNPPFSITAYSWRKNGVVVSTTNQFITSTLANNDTIQLFGTVSGTCITSTSAVSNQLIMQVAQPVTASVQINSNRGSSICQGQSVTFLATPVNGGTTARYVWKKNGVSVLSGNPSYTTTALANGDSVEVWMYSSIVCASPSPAISNSIVMQVNVAPGLPTVTKNDPICAGDTLILNATSTGTGNFVWTGPGGISGSGSTFSIPNVTSTSNGNWTVYRVSGVCTSSTRNFTVRVNPKPPKPVITLQLGGILTSSIAGFGNQWCLFGVPLPGETADFMFPTVSGTYTIVYTDPSTGCKSVSDPFILVGSKSVVLDQIKVYPIPSDKLIQWILPTGSVQTSFRILDSRGREVLKGGSSNEADIAALSAGIYWIEIHTTTQVYRSKIVR